MFVEGASRDSKGERRKKKEIIDTRERK